MMERIIDKKILEVIKRYPRLTSHLICESLGYFTPQAAARAIQYYKKGKPFYCEWYCHMAKEDWSRERLIEIGKIVIKSAFENRKWHRGMMSDYKQARKIVNKLLETGNGPVFASWF